MRAELENISLRDVYGHNKSYYTTDNFLEMMEFVLKNSFDRSVFLEKKFDTKEREKVKETEKAMSKAVHLVANANRILKEYAKIENEVKLSLNNVSEPIISSELRQIKNKITSDAITQIKEAIKITEKYGKSYICNLTKDILPSYDNRGKTLESSKYVLKEAEDYENIVSKNYISGIMSNTDVKTLVDESTILYYGMYKDLTNDVEFESPWKVPEVQLIDEMIKKSEDKKDLVKLENMKKFYLEFETAKRKLYTYSQVKQIFENSNFIKKYMKNSFEKLSINEEKSQKIVDKYKKQMESAEFRLAKKNIDEINLKIESSQKEKENLLSIQEQIKQKEKEIKELEESILSLEHSTYLKKMDYENLEQSAYESKYIPEHTVVKKINKDIYDPVTIEQTVPGHQEYIHDEKTRKEIMGDSQEVYIASKEKLKEQEQLLIVLKEELSNLKSVEFQKTSELEAAKKDYKKKSFMTKLMKQLKENNMIKK